MFSSKPTQAGALACAVACLLAGCGGSSPQRRTGTTTSGTSTTAEPSTAASGRSVTDVITAMAGQPRIVQTFTRGNTQRVVIDKGARYVAFFTRGKLTVMHKGGVQYILNRSCYSHFTAPPVNLNGLWLGWVHEVTGTRYTTSVTGGTVTYRSRFGHMVVDARTGLIRSAASTAVPGHPNATTFAYPASVAELATPRPLCQRK